jgi:hypothetical protein
MGTEAVLLSLVPRISSWQLLLAEITTGGMVYVGFVIFSPFTVVREIVRETAQDVLPRPALQVFNRLTAVGQV